MFVLVLLSSHILFPLAFNFLKGATALHLSFAYALKQTNLVSPLDSPLKTNPRRRQAIFLKDGQVPVNVQQKNVNRCSLSTEDG